MSRRADSTQDPRRRRTVVCEHLRINQKPVTDPAQQAALWNAIPALGLHTNSLRSHHVRALPVMRCAMQNQTVTPMWGTDVCLTNWGRECPYKIEGLPVTILYRGVRSASGVRTVQRTARRPAPNGTISDITRLRDARNLLNRSDRFGWDGDLLPEREQLALALLADHTTLTQALAHYGALARGPVAGFADVWLYTNHDLAEWLATQPAHLER